MFNVVVQSSLPAVAHNRIDKYCLKMKEFWKRRAICNLSMNTNQFEVVLKNVCQVVRITAATIVGLR